jgi:hypothetical protein
MVLLRARCDLHPQHTSICYTRSPGPAAWVLVQAGWGPSGQRGLVEVRLCTAAHPAAMIRDNTGSEPLELLRLRHLGGQTNRGVSQPAVHASRCEVRTELLSVCTITGPPLFPSPVPSPAMTPLCACCPGTAQSGQSSGSTCSTNQPTDR